MRSKGRLNCKQNILCEKTFLIKRKNKRLWVEFISLMTLRNLEKCRNTRDLNFQLQRWIENPKAITFFKLSAVKLIKL